MARQIVCPASASADLQALALQMQQAIDDLQRQLNAALARIAQLGG